MDFRSELALILYVPFFFFLWGLGLLLCVCVRVLSKKPVLSRVVLHSRATAPQHYVRSFVRFAVKPRSAERWDAPVAYRLQLLVRKI